MKRAGLGNTPEDRRFRHRYWLMAGIELWIAFASVIAAVGYYVSPESLRDSSLAHAVPELVSAWNAGYLIGAAAIVFAILRLRPSVEVLGLGVYSAAAMTNAVTILAVHGQAGAANAATLLGFSVGAACRGWALAATNRLAVKRAEAGEL